MIINFPRSRIKNISGLASSADTTSTMSNSASSFEKPELSKGLDHQIETTTKRPCSQHQQEMNDSANQIRKTCLKSQHNANQSSTKAVTFEKTARVRRVRTRHQFSRREHQDMWYSDEDYTAIKRRAVDTVKRMIKAELSGGLVDDDNYSSRGLECRMKKNAIERKEFKAFARQLVLDEQDDMNKNGMACDSRLRKVYLKASSISSTKARDKGRKDAEAIDVMSLCEVLQAVYLQHNNLQ